MPQQQEDRRSLLLEGQVLPAIWKLSAPTVAVMAMQGLVNTAEVYFVGRLGPMALAGASLCFPMMILMSAMSGAGLGGGISSAIARAIGARRMDRAKALAAHAMVLSALFGLFFTIVLEWGGGPLYRLLGGKDEALQAAVEYSTAFFRGVVLVWIFNAMASVFRGVGQPGFPAMVGAAGGLMIVVVSPALIFGWGPLPALGIAGAGVAVILYAAVGSLVLFFRLQSDRSPLHLTFRGVTWSRTLFGEILRVGLPSAAHTIVGNLGFMVMTGLVGRYGNEALAAFGLGTRFEFVLIPVIFGLGAAVVTLVGAAVGAGDVARAREVTKSGAAIAAAIWGVCGAILAVSPTLWLGIFTADARVLDLGSRYLRIAGPLYWMVGVGMILYFACQGAGEAMLPLLLSLLRFGVALLLGWAVVAFQGGVEWVFAAVTFGFVTYGAMLIYSAKVTFDRLVK